MYVFEYGHDIVVIDSGLMFPDAEKWCWSAKAVAIRPAD